MTTFSQALKELAEPRQVGDSIQAAIVRAARLAGLPYPRAFNVWYGRARRIDAHEADQINEALRVKREKEARDELYDLRARLIKMESRLASTDPDFHRPTIDFTRQQARGLGGENCPMVRKR